MVASAHRIFNLADWLRFGSRCSFCPSWCYCTPCQERSALTRALYETLSIYLLLAIGLKGGVELAKHPISTVAPQAVAVIAMGLVLPLLAYPILR